MENHCDVLIVGAGACGLVAAKELSAKSKSVIVLEAKAHAGGRIDTMHMAPFTQPVEGGAEFIHGNLPVTLQLLSEGNIGYTKIEGGMLRQKEGKWIEEEEEIEGWDELMQQMNALVEDTTFTSFLNKKFSDKKYDALRQSALQYANGFDAVDPDVVSVFSLRNEWQRAEDDNYRVNGGYKQLIDFLHTSCKMLNANVLFNQPVSNIKWQPGALTITTNNNEVFTASKVIITAPLGVLAATPGSEGSIQFMPALPAVQKAVAGIGFGNVIKILLQFSETFWLKERDALFYFSEQKISTWWSQSPSQYPFLTGWVAGKNANQFAGVNHTELLEVALQSVANIFGKTTAQINALLTASNIINWETDIYARGAYSYNMIGSEEAKKVLNKPIDNTLFFAGEALYSGALGGTVEAALVAGLQVADKIIGK